MASRDEHGVSADRAAVAPLPRVFESYELVREIGHGGMSRVYEARHLRLGKRVAVKLLDASLALDEKATARMLREGRALAQVCHPNVADVLDVGVADGVPFLVLELLDGITLRRYLECAAAPLSVSETLDIVLPIVSALSAVHARGIIHRDVKPENVFLRRQRAGEVTSVLFDFGVAAVDGVAEPREMLTAGDAVLGTIPYMAPEQTRGARHASDKSDQYSLAVVLYECVTGRRPFGGASSYDIMHAIVTSTPPRPREHVAGISAFFEEVVLRAMARRPEDRFASMSELGAALVALADEAARSAWEEEFAASASAGATLSDNAVPRRTPSRSGSRAGRRKMVLAVVCAAVAACSATAYWQPHAEAHRSAGAGAGEPDLSASVIRPAPPARAPSAPLAAVSASPPPSTIPPSGPSPRAVPPVRSMRRGMPLPSRDVAIERGTNGVPIVE